MDVSTLVLRAAAVAVAAIAVAGGATAPAAATTQYAVDHFKVCMNEEANDCLTRVEGDIVWGNRTATLKNGKVFNGHGGTATAFFSAYAGATKIDHTTRTASGVSTTPFSFVIGDTNLVGGINKINISISAYTSQLVVPGDSKVELRD